LSGIGEAGVYFLEKSGFAREAGDAKAEKGLCRFGSF